MVVCVIYVMSRTGRLDGRDRLTLTVAGHAPAYEFHTGPRPISKSRGANPTMQTDEMNESPNRAISPHPRRNNKRQLFPPRTTHCCAENHRRHGDSLDAHKTSIKDTWQDKAVDKKKKGLIKV